MHPFLLPLYRVLSFSLSVATFLLDWLQCQWTTTDSLLGSLVSREHSLVRIRVRTYVRLHVCASVIGNPGERTYLSTGNKLTSCRKLANVPWEDSPRERVVTGGSAGDVSCAATRNAPWRGFPKREFDSIRFDKTICMKTFYLKFIIYDAGLCDKCAVTEE